MEEKIFAQGISFKRRESAPDFVIGNLNIKVDEAIETLKNNEKNILTSKGGKPYVQVNTWTKDAETTVKTPEGGSDLPF